MEKQFVSNSKESARMFKNDFLELCSRVHYTVPLFIFIPVILYFCWKALFVAGDNILVFLGFFVFGVIAWTFSEYVIHRYIFHYEPTTAWGKRLHFIAHGLHHDYPNDHLRLVLPPSVTIPLAFIFYYLFSLFFSLPHLYAFFPGYVGGYLVYDMMHYAVHHFNFRNRFWKKMKQQHMVHHYNDPNKGYGVSSVMWDVIFRSEIEERRK